MLWLVLIDMVAQATYAAQGGAPPRTSAHLIFTAAVNFVLFCWGVRSGVWLW